MVKTDKGWKLVVSPARTRGGWLAGTAWMWLVLLLAACNDRANMREDAHLKPYEPNKFFPDAQSARPLVHGVIARGELVADEALTQGSRGGKLVERIPVEVTLELLRRGRDRYAINCVPCHGYDGYGDGMVVQRGYSKPPSYHIDRLRQAPDGHLFNVITNGLGRMPPYAVQVSPADRWAIVAYLRALQVSQHATLEDVPAGNRQWLESVQP